MPGRSKVEAIERIETEVCAFGSIRLALKEFRRVADAPGVRKLRDLKAFLATQSIQRIETMLGELKERLSRRAYPLAI